MDGYNWVSLLYGGSHLITRVSLTVCDSASEMTYIVSSGALNSTHYYYDCV